MLGGNIGAGDFRQSSVGRYWNGGLRTSWAQYGRCVEGFHGTSAAAAQSIIQSGIRPSTGGMLGPGVYWSDDLQKTRAYTRGGSTVLKLTIRPGRVKTIDRQGHPSQHTWHAEGYATAWVPAGCGMVASHLSENCTMDPSRIRVVAISGDNGSTWCAVNHGVINNAAYRAGSRIAAVGAGVAQAAGAARAAAPAIPGAWQQCTSKICAGTVVTVVVWTVAILLTEDRAPFFLSMGGLVFLSAMAVTFVARTGCQRVSVCIFATILLLAGIIADLVAMCSLRGCGNYGQCTGTFMITRCMCDNAHVRQFEQIAENCDDGPYADAYIISCDRGTKEVCGRYVRIKRSDQCHECPTACGGGAPIYMNRGSPRGLDLFLHRALDHFHGSSHWAIGTKESLAQCDDWSSGVAKKYVRAVRTSTYPRSSLWGVPEVVGGRPDFFGNAVLKSYQPRPADWYGPPDDFTIYGDWQGHTNHGDQNDNDWNTMSVSISPAEAYAECASVHCGPHGRCISGKCVCSGDYDGTYCDKDLCDKSKCAIGNHTACTRGTCDCEDDYMGRRCDWASGTEVATAMVLWPCLGIVVGYVGAVKGIKGNSPLAGLCGMSMGLVGVTMPITILVDLFGGCEGCDHSQMMVFVALLVVGFVCLLLDNKCKNG